jgi:dehydrogenase/reductase SDR family protein X
MAQQVQQPQFQFPKLSKEDQKIYSECRSESFYYRCVPFAFGFSAATLYAIRSGFLQASLRFGVVPKVLAASCLGYIAGKASYSKACADKFIRSPTSELGDQLRRQKGLKTAESDTDTPVDFGVRVVAPQKTPDYESYGDRPLSGFPDTYTPSLDLDSRFLDQGVNNPEPEKTVNYDELRRRNREEYEERLKRPIMQERDVPAMRPPPGVFEPRQPKNKYGDNWEG